MVAGARKATAAKERAEPSGSAHPCPQLGSKSDLDNSLNIRVIYLGKTQGKRLLHACCHSTSPAPTAWSCRRKVELAGVSEVLEAQCFQLCKAPAQSSAPQHPLICGISVPQHQHQAFQEADTETSQFGAIQHSGKWFTEIQNLPILTTTKPFQHCCWHFPKASRSSHCKATGPTPISSCSLTTEHCSAHCFPLIGTALSALLFHPCHFPGSPSLPRCISKPPAHAHFISFHQSLAFLFGDTICQHIQFVTEKKADQRIAGNSYLPCESKPNCCCSSVLAALCLFQHFSCNTLFNSGQTI